MNEITITYTEKDLFIYLQQIRLLKAKELNDSNIDRTNNVKEEKATFKGVMNNVGHFFERGVKNYKDNENVISKNIEEFNNKNPRIISEEEAKSALEEVFKDDQYGLAKLLFASTIILDDEYQYKYVEESLEEVSTFIFNDKDALLKIKKQLQSNYDAIAPRSLSNTQKGVLLGVAITSLVAVLTLPTILAPASAVAGAAAVGTGWGAIAMETIMIGAQLTMLTYVGMELYNNHKIKEEFRKLSPEKNAFYLALQCTYIQRIKETLSEDEFKNQLDNILKNLSTLKSDIDYYYFVEKESTKDNQEKIKSFHSFDSRLAKILGV